MKNIPKTMHAVLLTKHGGMEKLKYKTNIPVPIPKDDEVLIKVTAAGINNTDINTSTAWYSKYKSNAGGWLSVFGIDSEASIPDNHNLHDDDEKDVESTDPTECKNCQGTEYTGHEEWTNAFGDETLSSPFQDGHYIYRVIPGYGSGSNSVPPILYVADMEHPANFNAVLTP